MSRYHSFPRKIARREEAQMNAKDHMIDTYRKEADDFGSEYGEWLESLITDINEEYVAQLEARMTASSPPHKE